MLKIISQDGKEMYDLERNNIFVCGNKVLISDKVNIYESKAALLGMYNNEEEAEHNLMRIIETLVKIPNIDSNFFCIRMMPKAEEKEEQNNVEIPEILKNLTGGEIDGGEQGKTGENN